MQHEASQSNDDVEDQVAKAALRLVTEQGADAVSILDVMKALDIGRAAMARHCRSETELWQIVTRFIERRMAEWWSASVSADLPPSERLRSLVSVQVGLIMDMPALRGLLFSRGFNETNPALRDGLAQVRSRLAELIRSILLDGVGRGEFPPTLDVERTARRIIEMLQGMAVGWPLEAQADDALQEAWERVELIVRLSAQEQLSETSTGNLRNAS